MCLSECWKIHHEFGTLKVKTGEVFEMSTKQKMYSWIFPLERNRKISLYNLINKVEYFFPTGKMPKF